MTLRTAIVAACLALASAAVAADNPPAQQKPQTQGGGDGGAKPKAAAMVIEEEATASEAAAPPAPVGEEKQAIGRYIRENSATIHECYARALEKRPTLAGKLVARFDIGPNGRVIGATAEGIADRDLVVCVIQAVRSWQFDKPQSGGKLRIAYPFKFEPLPSR